ncbi:hypothetical protein JCM11641_003389 [Rhodosporidiobolus odoratus]
MGGGDLNMKKSWHTGTFRNQETVWKKEKEALEERKKLQQLQKELEQERAVQELQRLQESAGGKKREERVDWLYAAPAEGNGPNADELEAYLLGKKRVDKLLKGNEEQLLAQSSSSAPGGNFQSTQNANTVRDTAAKIREDPLLAIKRQEQAQYEKMLKDPRRLRELREAKARAIGGATPSRDGGETKEERRARKEAKRAEREERREERSSRRRGEGDRERSSRNRPHHDRSRSRSPRRDHDGARNGYSRSSRDDRQHPSSSRRDDRSPRHDDRSFRHHGDRLYRRDQDRDPHTRRPSPSYNGRPSPSFDRRPPSPRRSDASYRPSHPSRPPASSSAAPPPPAVDEAERKAAIEARLAAMQSSAAALSASRTERMTAQDVIDKAELEKEERERAQKGRAGDGVGPRFLNKAQGQVFGGGMDLAERMRRSGKVGMVGDGE